MHVKVNLYGFRLPVTRTFPPFFRKVMHADSDLQQAAVCQLPVDASRVRQGLP